MLRTPKSVTLTEANPGTVEQYLLSAKDATSGAVVASHAYAPTGGITICPIGSDGFFSSVADGVAVRLFVIERGPGGNDAPEQEFSGGPFTLGSLPDGAESLSVQV